MKVKSMLVLLMSLKISKNVCERRETRDCNYWMKKVSKFVKSASHLPEKEQQICVEIYLWSMLVVRDPSTPFAQSRPVGGRRRVVTVIEENSF